MDELWQVAKGHKKYAEFKNQRQGGGGQQQRDQEELELDPELVTSPLRQPQCVAGAQ